MANSTFSGPVRSEGNFDLVSKDSTSGLVSNRTISDGVQDSRRYYLKEWWNLLPKLQTFMIGSATKDFGSIADGNEEEQEMAHDFEIINTSDSEELEEDKTEY